MSTKPSIIKSNKYVLRESITMWILERFDLNNIFFYSKFFESNQVVKKLQMFDVCKIRDFICYNRTFSNSTRVLNFSAFIIFITFIWDKIFEEIRTKFIKFQKLSFLKLNYKHILFGKFEIFFYTKRLFFTFYKYSSQQ